jgi:DNA polymerase family A
LKQIGKQALDRFITGTPGLRQLRGSLQSHARTHAWLPGLDGRRVPVRALHSALNFIVTSSEAIICKRWLINVHDELCTRFRYGWNGDVVIVLWVHDELACCCRPEIAEQVGEIMVRHPREPAEFYHFKTPLDAEYKIGRSWAGEPVNGAATEIITDSGMAARRQTTGGCIGIARNRGQPKHKAQARGRDTKRAPAGPGLTTEREVFNGSISDPTPARVKAKGPAEAAPPVIETFAVERAHLSKKWPPVKGGQGTT